MGADPFRVLDLTPGCTKDELKAAYRRAARAAHPDAGGSEARFREVRSAYEQLLDPAARAARPHHTDPASTAAGESSRQASSSTTSGAAAGSARASTASGHRTGPRADPFDSSRWFDDRLANGFFAPFHASMRTDRSLAWLRSRAAARAQAPAPLHLPAALRPSLALVLFAVTLANLRSSLPRLPYALRLPHPVLLALTLTVTVHLLRSAFASRRPALRHALRLLALLAVLSWTLPAASLCALGAMLLLSSRPSAG